LMIGCTRSDLPKGDVRVAGLRRSCLTGPKRSVGTVCDDDRSGNGDTMNMSGIERYRAYLTRRDGDADLLHRRLASREEFFSALEADPVRSTRHIDRNVFLRNLRRRRPHPGLAP